MDKVTKSVIYGKNVMSAQMLEVSPLGVGVVLRLERDAWSTVTMCASQEQSVETSTPGGGELIIMHGRSRMTIDPRTRTMPGRSTPGFHQPGRQCLLAPKR